MPKIEVVVYKDNTYGLDFLEWVSEIVQKTPEEFRHNLRMATEVSERYGDSYAEIIVSYLRAETEDEIARRKNSEIIWKKDREELERQQFEILKAKYGSKT